MEKKVEEIIGFLEKPLRFASKDGFAHLGVLKDVEPLAVRLATELTAFAPSYASFSEKLKKMFRGFDALPTDTKAGVVDEALAFLATIHGREEAAPAPAPEPAKLPTVADTRNKLKQLASPVEKVSGIGPKLAEVFAKKGISTIEDLLYFLPIRYEDRSALVSIRELQPGTSATVTAEVLAFGETRYGRRRVYEMAVGDGTGILKLKWFNYKKQYMARYKVGQKLSVYGPVSTFGGQKEIIHPDIEILEGDKAGKTEAEREPAEGLVPVYSQVGNMHQKTLRRIVGGAVSDYASLFGAGGLPAAVMKRHRLMTAGAALRVLHAVDSGDSLGEREVEAAKRSLVFEELFMLEAGLALRRESTRELPGVTIAAPPGGFRLETRLRSLLPFSLTKAQERVLAEISTDMAEARPMNRLLQGDVGSGKTVVSLIAALRAVEAGFQAAIMAPTEILAEQHFLSIHKYAEELGVRPVLLTGGMKKAERQDRLEDIASGAVPLVVGTHALIQKEVEFARLGLVVIDEQHRFGVAQRAVLRAKGGKGADGALPDVLIMTATPIPRTLSMTVFGDLDVSIIDELPPGRTPIKTHIVREKDRARAYEAIRREVSAGSQAYIVYPLVEESAEMSLRDATRMSGHLDTDIFPEFIVGLLHGRMKAAEKEEVMGAFKAGSINILVSTTVIEVGVDVPNATVMMVEHAERFGLAQLHQLRGRVGRGDKPSLCLLLAAWTQSEDTYKRLKVMEATTDGFRIAEEDLKIRGPGDFIGTRQAGLPGFRLSFALTDMKVLKEARTEAFAFVERDPRLTSPEGRVLREVINQRWAGRLELAETG